MCVCVCGGGGGRERVYLNWTLPLTRCAIDIALYRTPGMLLPLAVFCEVSGGNELCTERQTRDRLRRAGV